MTANVNAKLRKVKALAEAGSPGEREAAQAMLDRLTLKYGIHEVGSGEEPNYQYKFGYKDKFEKTDPDTDSGKSHQTKQDSLQHAEQWIQEYFAAIDSGSIPGNEKALQRLSQGV